MLRRTFLALTGASAAVGRTGREAMSTPGGPPHDRARLSARNRDRSSVTAQRGMVCASQPLATLVGIESSRPAARAWTPPSPRTPPWGSWSP